MDENESKTAALKQAAELGEQLAPPAPARQYPEVEVLFIGLAERVVAGPRSEPVREIVGSPGQKVKLSGDRAAAWMRRGRALLADSEPAKAWLKDKAAQEQAEKEAAALEAKARSDAKKRDGELERQREADADKKAAAAA